MFRLEEFGGSQSRRYNKVVILFSFFVQALRGIHYHSRQMKLFHWGLLLRYMVYGVLPLVVGFIIVERWVGEGAAGVFFVVLALVLPFVAIGWLGWQHFRHRNQK